MVEPIASKTVNDIAQEVIDGKWGRGGERRRNLEKAGWKFSDVMRAISEKERKSNEETDKGKFYDKDISGKYMVKNLLNMRSKAGQENASEIIAVLGPGTFVEADGYYDVVDNCEWLHVKNGSHEGFCHSGYLTKV